MKKVQVSILSILVIVSFVAAMLAGCGTKSEGVTQETTGVSATTAQTSTTQEETEPKIDISKKVDLQLFMVGDAPNDLAEISGKINEMAKKDLNCSIVFNYTTWSDITQKYNLLLSSGQPIDLIYTATWMGYFKLANAGAFIALDELLPKYAPELYKYVGEDYLNQVKVGGKIYTIPSIWKEYSNNGLTYRKDLMKKYNLPEPNSLENVEKYFEGIKQNLPSQMITNEAPVAGSGFSAAGILDMKYKRAFTAYSLYADYDQLGGELQRYWGSQDFIDDMKMFKRWADKGFWSKSALSAKLDPSAFNIGKVIAVITGENVNKYAQKVMELEISNPDWEVGYYPYCYSTGIAKPVHPAANGFAIPLASENPERALMFYEKLVLDKTYNQLSQYGIEGKHYTVQNGYYTPVGDTTTSGFPREGMNGWAWRNPEYMLYPQTFDVAKNLFAEFEQKYPTKNIQDGFSEDYTSYQSERAALQSVISQYLIPLQAGMVPDVESGVKIFMEKAEEAGLKKIEEEVSKQYKKYISDLGY